MHVSRVRHRLLYIQEFLNLGVGTLSGVIWYAYGVTQICKAEIIM